MATEAEHKDIYAAMAAAYHECGYVQKDTRKGLNYTYASEASLIKALRPALLKHGIVVFPTTTEVVANEVYKTGSGSSMNRVQVLVTYRFTHASGTYIDVQAAGEGADVGDKATAKAMTIAYKYALRQAFLIETGDDPDETPSETQRRDQPHVDTARLGAYLRDIGRTVQSLAPVLGVPATAVADGKGFLRAVEAWALKERITGDPVDVLIDRLETERLKAEANGSTK